MLPLQSFSVGRGAWRQHEFIENRLAENKFQMPDDLRDYRFCEKDMVYPNDTARDYIWDMFKRDYLDQNAQSFVEQWQRKRITGNLQHRSFQPGIPAHQEFIKKTLKLIAQLPGGYRYFTRKRSIK